MAKAIGLGGFFFKADNPRGLLAWYQTWLGFPLESSSHSLFPPSPMPAVFAIFPRDTDHFGPSPQQFMVNIVVDDLEETLSQVEAGGAVPVRGVKTYAHGKFGWFIDPEGNLVELWEPKRVPDPEE